MKNIIIMFVCFFLSLPVAAGAKMDKETFDACLKKHTKLECLVMDARGDVFKG